MEKLYLSFLNKSGDFVETNETMGIMVINANQESEKNQNFTKVINTNFMKKLNIIIILLSFGITSLAQKNNTIIIEYEVKRVGLKEYELNFIFTIPDSQKIISPFANDSSLFKTSIHFQRIPNIILLGSLNESPESKEEYYPKLSKMVKFNRATVKFSQMVKVINDQSCKMGGIISYMVVAENYNRFPCEIINFTLIYDGFSLSFTNH